MKKKLLVIDDSPAFREAIAMAGEDHGWMVMASEDLVKIKIWLGRHSPDVVLLDWQLPDRHRQQYVDLLKNKKLTRTTLLLSAAMDDAREQFIEEYGLAGYRLKPIDLERFEEEFELLEKSSYELQLEQLFDSIEVAIHIFDGKFTELFANKKAKEEPLKSPQILIVKWLRAEMEVSKRKAARRLDWDGEKECFLETRLFQLEDGNYWLARDWRIVGEWLHDHEILDLEKADSLKDWLKAVAKLLAQRYAISRFRMYKIAPLPNIEKIEYPNDQLVIPFFQTGGGFKPSEEAWRRTGFLPKDNPPAEKALKSNYNLQPELVHDTNPDTNPDTKYRSVLYGQQGTYRVIWPVYNKDRSVALFAFDRRLDHIAQLKEGSFDREMVEAAKRMASDDAGVLNQDQWSLMQGLIKDLGERLAIKLTADEDERTIKWHKIITKIIKNTFAEAGRSPEMIYEGLSKVCTALAQEWNNMTISGHIMGTTPWLQSEEGHPISTWYIALMTDETHWQAVAGWGNTYEACRQYGGHELMEPHATAKAKDAWKATVVQNFQNWTQREPNHSYRYMKMDQVALIGAWLAVPIQVDGSVRALMVVHSPHAYYFTAFRVNLMENTAERLLSLLAAAERETRARSAFAASVMHEVKNDSHTALMILDQIQKEATSQVWAISLAEIRHHLEGLNALGQDTLDIFQLGLDKCIPIQSKPDKALSITMESLIKGTIVGWHILYPDTTLEREISEALATRKISITHHLAFKRVLRVLLHNAFRHGRQWVRIEVALDESHKVNGGGCLNITVKNLADEQMINNLTERLNPAISGLGSSPFIRGRLGLAVARQLVKEAGGFLDNLQLSKTNAGDTEAIINLAWPITLIDDILESAS
jgi:DNA-binding response OmpR family regulator